ncbi:molecular chaperone DnaJ [Streptomyces sp. SID3343]|uniref:molecular chaperone DnaJ n=1 Tax=Streptomyces sp. SID3343 TaxID=2690260 RepID=UPI00136E3639|nr:molecular chaperone DnaJ [Streptomyces sp. SID3343]MYW05957.1 molecular chaperone DnaJ [Streptomyces sp. SID3343]
MATDYYETLGVRRDATPEEIKKAFRRLARELHPDVNPDPKTQDRFKEINNAYEVLSDPQKRQMYDLGGDPLSSGGGGGGGFGQAGFGFSDIMDAFFGQASQRGPRSRTRRGQDAMIRIEVALEEAAFGTTRDIQVDTAVTCNTCNGEGAAPGTTAQTCDMCRGRGEVSQVTKSFLGQVMTSRPCPQCQGFGTVVPHPCAECAGDGRIRARRTLTVKIPAGVDSGTRIQLAGEGEVGPGGGPAGDLYVEIVEVPHNTFQRRGDDLHCTVTIPMTAASLGTKVPLQTLDGIEEIDIRPGTQSGQSIPLHGRGITHLRGGGRGDLVVHVEVQTPNKLDPEQEELIKRLAKLRGEERPSGQFTPGQQGLFSRLKDAFNGR